MTRVFGWKANRFEIGMLHGITAEQSMDKGDEDLQAILTPRDHIRQIPLTGATTAVSAIAPGTENTLANDLTMVNGDLLINVAVGDGFAALATMRASAVGRRK